MAPDGLSFLYDAKAIDPLALPPFVGLAALPQGYRDHLQLELERHGRLPGVKSRVMMKRSLYKSLALHGQHEDDAEEEKRKKRLLDRWLVRYLAVEAMLWALMERISSTRETLDAEIDNLNNQINDLKTLPETDHHLETLEQLEQNREKLARYREKTDRFEANGLAAGNVVSKSGVRSVNSAFTEFQEKVSNYMANMRTQRHSAEFNTMGNAVSAAAAAATASHATPPEPDMPPPASTSAANTPPSSGSTAKKARKDDEDAQGGQSSPPGGTPEIP